MNRKIILASGSPRRKEIMQMAGLAFEVRVKNTSEAHPENVDVTAIPAVLAERKAQAFYEEITSEIIVAADTIVILNGKIFEKPKDEKEAIEMLSVLSGNTHQVITGVCLLSKDDKVVFSESTFVTFNTLTQEEIENYVRTAKPFDKAGAYACQESIGAIGIKRFDGDYYNVVGLPINRVYQELKKILLR